MAHVGVVIPAYNPGPFLRDALRSVLDQTWTDWECVVIDDGSDEDLTWVEDLDPRVRRIRQDNQGLASARNRGISETTAPLLAFLDADDLWEPAKLEKQVAVQKSTSAALVSTTFQFINANGLIVKAGYSSSAASYADLLRGNGICASTVLASRKVLTRVGGFDSKLRRVEDWDAWLRIAKSGGLLVHVDCNLARYRLHDHNMSSRYVRNWAVSNLVLCRNLVPALQYRQWGDSIAAVSGMRRMAILYGAQAFDAFRKERRVRHLAWAIFLGPVGTARAAFHKLRRSPR